MSRMVVALRLEITLQWRYRFVHAAALSGILWLALLLPMSTDLRATAEPYIVLGDLTIVGFYFIAGGVFFEKGERTLDAVVASPLRFHEYLASKVAALTGLSVLIAVFVAAATRGYAFNAPLLVLGTGLGTVLMLLLGFLTSLPFQSISDWFMPAVFPIAVFNLPIFHYSGVWDTPWLYLVPTQGPLLILGAAFHQKELTAWQAIYSVGYPLLAAAGMWLLARRLFDKYLVAKTGGA